MPPLWSVLNENTFMDFNVTGVNVFAIFGTQVSGNTCQWWVPDIVFPDAIDIDRTNENFFIYPGGRVAYQSQISMSMTSSSSSSSSSSLLLLSSSLSSSSSSSS